MMSSAAADNGYGTYVLMPEMEPAALSEISRSR
jgi:hypothetical protein